MSEGVRGSSRLSSTKPYRVRIARFTALRRGRDEPRSLASSRDLPRRRAAARDLERFRGALMNVRPETDRIRVVGWRGMEIAFLHLLRERIDADSLGRRPDNRAVAEAVTGEFGQSLV